MYLITLHAPHSNAGGKEKLDIYCVHVKERADSVPAGEEPVEWRLLTSHEVTSLAQAVQCIDWYRCRWLIEELFRLMKSKGIWNRRHTVRGWREYKEDDFSNHIGST